MGSSARVAAVGRWLCLAAAVLGALGLVGWFSGARALTQPFPTRAPMMPNTAASLMLLGAAGAIVDRDRLRRGVARVAAGIVLALGLLTLGEYAFGVDLGIDEVLVRTAVPSIGRCRKSVTPGVVPCCPATKPLFTRSPRPGRAGRLTENRALVKSGLIK